MPIPSPFHERVLPLCKSYKWKDWAGYYAVCTFDHCHEKEYHAFRQSSGMIDVTPLYKYEVYGPGAEALLNRMMVKNIGKLKPGRVTYCCWADDRGKVIDDGTVTRWDEDYFRVTAADPTYHWLKRLSRGHDVQIEDTSQKIGVVALQGPTSREILRRATDADVDKIKFFRGATAKLDGGIDIWITRTGYTGDLGYEVWAYNEQCPKVWDALIHHGKDYGIEPAGLDALDMTRIEAGFIMLDVDYYSAPKQVLESRKSTPYELGLGWTVNLDRAPFIGQAALKAEKERGSEWAMVGLVQDWEELEALYWSYGLPPNLPAQACRDSIPVYFEKKQIGRATSHTWSPVLKQMISLASVRAPYAKPGMRLQIEHTVEFERRTVTATVQETPFFNPERKRKP